MRNATGESSDYPAAQIYAAGLLTYAALSSSRSLDDKDLRAAFSDLRTTTMFGDFSIDRVTGRQLGHKMLLVQWQRGRKVIIHPEAHTNTGLHDSLPGWRLLRAGAEMLGLTHPNDTTEK
jgi:branched-chain amino acid transport system substrate-binding protein